MSKFRVSRFLERDLVVRVSFLNTNGIITNTRKLFKFYPEDDMSNDGWYETTDEVLLASIKELTEQIPYTEKAEQSLKQADVTYDYAYCPSCGGKRVRKLKYNLFEVVD